jgi:hypothetical protein
MNSCECMALMCFNLRRGLHLSNIFEVAGGTLSHSSFRNNRFVLFIIAIDIVEQVNMGQQ